MTTKGISGVSVALATAGGYLVYAAIKKVPILQGLRDLSQGKISPGAGAAGPSNFLATLPTLTGAAGVATGSTPAQSETGEKLVAAARKYLGVPYRWGGTDPRTGLDCSALVQRAFADIGITDCPRTSLGISRWSKLGKVSSPQTGDILWWMGHVAIATSPTTMIEAPTIGLSVRETALRSGALILRYRG